MGLSTSHRRSVCGNERESSSVGHCQGTQMIYHPNIPSSITNSQDRTASLARVVPGNWWCGGPVPIPDLTPPLRSLILFGTVLANQPPAPLHFPFRCVRVCYPELISKGFASVLPSFPTSPTLPQRAPWLLKLLDRRPEFPP